METHPSDEPMEPSVVLPAKIVQMDSMTARRISSGQVIATMAVAVKELIENSLDAGATTIMVKFHEHGTTSIQVSDNGHGIHECNFELIARRHCTSKIVTTEDLERASTFGFRGEALNSLCNIANLSVHTRHAAMEMGAEMVFDGQGKMVNLVRKAREVGTTITLKDLFVSLPVRRKQLMANSRRSFDSTVALICQYCCGLIGVRISVIHVEKQGGRTMNMFTCSGKSIQSNIVEVFDHKQFTSLMPFVPVLAESELDEPRSGKKIDFQVTGFISKPDTGCGRSSSDRQYFYLNQRPCDISGLYKKINQIYRQMNRNQYPFILLQIQVDETLIDRNLSPDKRTIMLADNHQIHRHIVRSLEAMFSQRQQNELASLNQSKDGDISKMLNDSIQKRNISIGSTDDNDDGGDDSRRRSSKQLCVDMRRVSSNDPLMVMDPPRYSSRSSLLESSNDSLDLVPSVHRSMTIVGNNNNQERLKTNKENQNWNILAVNRSNEHSDDLFLKPRPDSPSRFQAKNGKNDDSNQSLDESLHLSQAIPIGSSTPVKDPTKVVQLSTLHPFFNSLNVNFKPKQDVQQQQEPRAFEASNPDRQVVEESPIEPRIQQTGRTTQIVKVQDDAEEEEEDVDDDDEEEEDVKIVRDVIEIKSGTIEDICSAYERSVQLEKSRLNEEDQSVEFHARLSPEDNEIALKELKHSLDRQSFATMQVIGQFNQGFIVGQLNRNLFIIDQHAINERVNFEKLLDNPGLSHQPLLVPMELRLSSLNESLVERNLETFEQLGFGLIVDREAPVGRKVSLVKVPQGKDWQGGREDLEEVMAALRDSPTGDLRGSHFVLSGLKREIAYRACRSSIMIGEPLNHDRMERLLAEVVSVRDPWHCAHNRPTIRHLACLDHLKQVNDSLRSIDSPSTSFSRRQTSIEMTLSDSD